MDPSELEYWDQPDLRKAVWSDDDWEQGIEDCLGLILPHMPAEGRILDVGSGIGRLAAPLRERTGLEVWCYEPSETMRHNTPLGLTVMAEWLDVTFDAAYTVAVLQHLQYGQQQNLIRHTAGHLRKGARFICQTVKGDTDSPGSHHVPYSRLTGWLTDVGLRPSDVWFDAVRSGWMWILSEKR